MIKFLTVKQVIEIHDAFLNKGLPGIRDLSALESAVEMPKMHCFGKVLHESMHDKASAYMYHIIKNHPFNDGNKRTGSLSAVHFLHINGINTDYPQNEFLDFVCEVGKGKKTKSDIAEFLIKHSK